MFWKPRNYFQALTLLLVNCGWRKTITILTRWPSYVILPLFSIFTFTTERIGSRKLLVYSTRWTLVNLLITILGLSLGALFLNSEEEEHLSTSSLIVIVATPLMFVAIIFYTILLTAESCTCTCKYDPYIKRLGLDIETLEIVDLGYHDLHSRLQTLVNSL